MFLVEQEQNTEAKYRSRNYKKKGKTDIQNSRIHDQPWRQNTIQNVQDNKYSRNRVTYARIGKNTGDNSTQFQIYTHIYIHIHTHICTHIYYAVKHKANFSSDGCKTTSLVRLFHSPTVLGKNEYVKQLLRV